MKKFSVLALCIILTITLFTGCSLFKKEEETEPAPVMDEAVFGTWSEDYFDSGFTFLRDMTGKDTFWDLSFTYTAYDGIITITYDDETYAQAKYTYSVSGDTITMTRQSDDGVTVTYEKTAEAPTLPEPEVEAES